MRSLFLLLFLGLTGCASRFAYLAQPVEIHQIYQRGSSVSLFRLNSPEAAGAASSNQVAESPSEIPLSRFSSYRPHRGGINALAVAPNGLAAFTGGQDGEVVISRLVEASAKNKGLRLEDAGITLEREVLLSTDKPVWALGISPDERKLAVGQYSSVIVIDLEKRAVEAQLTKLKGRIVSLEWDPSGELLALGRADGGLYVWNVSNSRSAGEDSMEAVEEYPGAISPLVVIKFHPRGRSFFAAELDGRVVMWRLLRTDRSLGLWDDKAVVDQVRKGRYFRNLGSVVGRITSMWLEADGSELWVASTSGHIYRWKTRGLLYSGSFAVAKGGAFGILGVPAIASLDGVGGSAKKARVLITSGRDQRIQFWCKAYLTEREELPGERVVIESTGYSTSTAQGPASHADIPASAEGGSLLRPRSLLAESARFEYPISILSRGERSGVLWAVQKTGNLLLFDMNSLAGFSSTVCPNPVSTSVDD